VRPLFVRGGPVEDFDAVIAPGRTKPGDGDAGVGMMERVSAVAPFYADGSPPCAAFYGARRIYRCPGITGDMWKFPPRSCEDSRIRFVPLPEMGKVELRADPRS